MVNFAAFGAAALCTDCHSKFTLQETLSGGDGYLPMYMSTVTALHITLLSNDVPMPYESVLSYKSAPDLEAKSAL